MRPSWPAWLQLWHPDRLAPLYRDFFSNLVPQPSPPVVPKQRNGTEIGWKMLA
jgi:hypothetical protein